MSGHSKWSSIKHQKGVTDARRGKLFTKLTKEIILSVREHGSNPDSNYHLRLAIQRARDNNMPSDNIERAIKRGDGTLDGIVLSEFVLEGYGPGGTAIMVEVFSDNRNRTVQEVRSTFTRSGGNMGENGSVTWLFEQKGIITIEADETVDAEELAMLAIDAGAEDVHPHPEYVEIYTRIEDMENVRKALEDNKVTVDSAEFSRVPKTTIQLEDSVAMQVLKLLERLEELDDTRNVYSNVDFSDKVLEKYEAQE